MASPHIPMKQVTLYPDLISPYLPLTQPHSLLFLQDTRHIPTSGPLHLLLPLPRTLFLHRAPWFVLVLSSNFALMSHSLRG